MNPIQVQKIELEYLAPHCDGFYKLTIKGNHDLRATDGLTSNTGDGWMIRYVQRTEEETVLSVIRFKPKRWMLPARRRHSSKPKDRMPSMVVLSQRAFHEANN
ncbi:MAG TPA: hypothetical protein VFO76_09940 [Candidatus Kapabacteria bacterium]|nr:hypothetical protein [Candidatus Kapabacteria bacterium]